MPFRDEYPLLARLCAALIAGETLRGEARGQTASVSARAVAIGAEVQAHRDAFDAARAFVAAVGFSGAEAALGRMAA